MHLKQRRKKHNPEFAREFIKMVLNKEREKNVNSRKMAFILNMKQHLNKSIAMCLCVCFVLCITHSAFCEPHFRQTYTVHAVH